MTRGSVVHSRIVDRAGPPLVERWPPQTLYSPVVDDENAPPIMLCIHATMSAASTL